jgi:hypothetical protein
MENVSEKICRETKIRILCSVTVLRNSCRIRDNVKRYGKAGANTDDSTIMRMRLACWVAMARNTHS